MSISNRRRYRYRLRQFAPMKDSSPGVKRSLGISLITSREQPTTKDDDDDDDD